MVLRRRQARAEHAVRSLVAIGFCGLSWGVAAPAVAAPTTVPSAPITGIAGGWNDNVMRARLDGPFVNPQGCPIADGYITDPTVSGANLFNSMLMSAYMANKPVTLIVDGCYLDRPRIISVLMGTF